VVLVVVVGRAAQGQYLLMPTLLRAHRPRDSTETSVVSQ
jgi:hypothetical protein